MKWCIVAFKHPNSKNSVLYRQGLTKNGLITAIYDAIEREANLMSIRGFPDVKELTEGLNNEKQS